MQEGHPTTRSNSLLYYKKNFSVPDSFGDRSLFLPHEPYTLFDSPNPSHIVSINVASYYHFPRPSTKLRLVETIH